MVPKVDFPDATPMADRFERPPFTWRRKFGYAFRGLALAARAERSFRVHGVAAIAVVLAAAALGCSPWEWCALALAIGGVFAAEFFNSALERLAQAITAEERPEIRDALDIAAGAVFVAALASVGVGVIVFGCRAWSLLTQ